MKEGNKKYSFRDAYGNHNHHDYPLKKTHDKIVNPQHYHFEIEPFDYIHDNDMGFAEGNVIKYITRWKYKDGIKDLYKAKKYIEMLIEKEEKEEEKHGET
tara:strand:- start:776 stop:1075 length:300 start_codon:yes stop_codon:yes gene_type:complete